MGRHLLGSPDLQGNVRERASAVSIRGSREGSVEPRLASYRVLQTVYTVTHGLGTTDAWGLRLGIRVASIRSTGRYVKDNEDRIQKLEDLGFEVNVRTMRCPVVVGSLLTLANSCACSQWRLRSNTNRGGSVQTAPTGGRRDVGGDYGDPSSVSFEAMMNALNIYKEVCWLPPPAPHCHLSPNALFLPFHRR